jgi:hypothetical protein
MSGVLKVRVGHAILFKVYFNSKIENKHDKYLLIFIWRSNHLISVHGPLGNQAQIQGLIIKNTQDFLWHLFIVVKWSMGETTANPRT